LGRNDRSRGDITQTWFNHTGIIDQELFIVSTNR
jgi:hypothetical protein